ncbi:MAG: translation initiation factor IF-2 N-terminal domain-containing protein, partial [Clostridia bacterium]|nr:translation initiation factor IF-2 N-terminal domain-containing protein [Clostridia bacterium]
MPREKYKVHEVAKDFGTTSKKILELLAKYSDIERKHTTVLEDAELDFLFDSITQANEVASFDAYFAAAAEQQAAKAEAPKAEEAAPAAQAKAEKPAPVSGKAAPVSGKAAPVSGKAAPVSGKAAPVSGKAAPASGKPDAPKAAPQPAPQPPKKKEKDKNKPMQARTKGETKRVDTRQSNVDLDKYNERYEEIAPANRMNSDNTQRKQKLNQKSKQYRKPGANRSQKRETEAERLKRIAAERAKHQITIKVPDEITVGELAAMLKMTAAEVIKKLFSLGVMATVNEVIDFDTAEIVATELGAKVEKQVVVTIEEQIIDDSEDKEEDLQRRDPVVVVMGHVDHGKTSILDAIRNTAVTATEAGGITQHIGAYRVEIGGQMITFLDTPGHAAFTSMRARGAMATDIAVLVVAADDGIMPQTIEAINHAKAAGVQIIVAINKMDKEGANPERIKQQLTEYSLVPEEWGGDTICVPVSAKTQMGIDSLLESILLVAEMADLKANPNRAAKGVVIEA